MANLLLKVNNQSLIVKTDIEKIVENSINYLSISHELSSDWDNLSIKYLFEYEEETYDGYENFVPRHVIKAPGFKVSIVGFAIEGDNLIQKITTEPVFVNIYPSGKTNGTLITKEELEADWLEMIQSTVDSANRGAEQANTTAENAVNIANETKSIAQTAETNSQLAVNTANEAKTSATIAETNSENAVNIANEANNKIIDVIEQVPNNYANALKGDVSGKTVSFNDVSPVEHKVKVKINTNGKNLLNPNSALENIGSYLGIRLLKKDFPYTLSISLKDGATVSSSVSFGMIYYSIEDTSAKALWLLENGTVKRNSCSTNQVLQNVSLENLDSIIVGIYPATQETWDAVFNAFNVQLEKDVIVTDYEPYIDPTSVTVTGCGKNLLNLNKPFDVQETYGGWLVNPTGEAVTMSLIDKNPNIDISGLYFGFTETVVNAPVHSWMIQDGVINNTICSAVDTNYYVSIYPKGKLEIFKQRFDVLVEYGNTATEYEPFKGGSYTPNSDGIVYVKSVSPFMQIFTDNPGITVECEYNRDINKAFAELQQAIISLGGNI